MCALTPPPPFDLISFEISGYRYTRERWYNSDMHTWLAGGIPINFFPDSEFPLELHAERHFTVEPLFRFFNVTADNRRVRYSNQIENNVIVMQKGPHLRRWLAACAR